MLRANLVNLSLFGVFFGLHIVFAARDLALAFSLVATLITVQILLFGPLSVVLGGASVRRERQRTNRLGALLSLPLSTGLAWAYGGMAWSWPVVFALVCASSSLHLVLDRRLSRPANRPAWVG